MSFTSTIEEQPQHTKSLLLSPSKRRRISNATSEDTQIAPQYTPAELWKWTLTSDAVASCFVKDVFQMTETTVKDPDFFWLGRVPCRNVRLVGMVVGLQIYEKRITYTVDDGTAVVDCVHRQTPPPASPVKPGKSPKLPQMPKPIARVGSLIRLVGKVSKWHDSRQIIVDHLEKCLSSNDEPIHWRTVRTLHETYYDILETFIMPPPTVIVPSSNADTSDHIPPPSTPHGPRTQHQIPDSANTASTSSPSNSSVSAYSPVKSISLAHPQSPPRLRHPSRLHSRDLTTNAFRIYLKHFMDNAPSERDSTHDLPHNNASESESDCDSISYSIANAPVTPTKRSRHAQPQTDRTPRPSAYPSDQTPRPHIRPPVFVHPNKAPAPVHGFTLSYLRRVPELSDMAKRVVKAEAKRKTREERKNAKEASAKGKTVVKSNKTEAAKGKERIGPKMKRLFEWAIVKLYLEGSIILWEGPVRTFSPRSTLDIGTSGLWKANSSTNTSMGADSTVFSSVGGATQADDEEDEGELSDPRDDEEAYISLTPSYFAPYVENAIREFMIRAAETERPKRLLGRVPGPTKEEITLFLRRMDERWVKVGDWAVGDALDVLLKEGKVVMVGRGRWELLQRL